MKKLLLILILLPCISFSQKKDKLSYKKQQAINSINQINQLHDGALLIRLSTKQKSIDALNKLGRTKAADKVEQEQLTRNKEIIAAFRSKFDFCPVYFFYSDQSKHLINQNIDSVMFINDEGQRDASIKLNKTGYLTGEFGTLEQDTSSFQGAEYYDRGKKKTENYGGSEISFTGLIIKNSQLYQLKHPFPFYAREFKGLFFQRSIDKVITRMNDKLHNFYKENS